MGESLAAGTGRIPRRLLWLATARRTRSGKKCALVLERSSTMGSVGAGYRGKLDASIRAERVGWSCVRGPTARQGDHALRPLSFL
jgi:hypothetical protein